MTRINHMDAEIGTFGKYARVNDRRTEEVMGAVELLSQTDKSLE